MSQLAKQDTLSKGGSSVEEIQWRITPTPNLTFGDVRAIESLLPDISLG